MECFAKKVKFSRELFSGNTPSYMFDRILNTPLESTVVFTMTVDIHKDFFVKKFIKNCKIWCDS